MVRAQQRLAVGVDVAHVGEGLEESVAHLLTLRECRPARQAGQGSNPQQAGMAIKAAGAGTVGWQGARRHGWLALHPCNGGLTFPKSMHAIHRGIWNRRPARVCRTGGLGARVCRANLEGSCLGRRELILFQKPAHQLRPGLADLHTSNGQKGGGGGVQGQGCGMGVAAAPNVDGC